METNNNFPLLPTIYCNILCIDVPTWFTLIEHFYSCLEKWKFTFRIKMISHSMLANHHTRLFKAMKSQIVGLVPDLHPQYIHLHWVSLSIYCFTNLWLIGLSQPASSIWSSCLLNKNKHTNRNLVNDEDLVYWKQSTCNQPIADSLYCCFLCVILLYKQHVYD